jgi:hypothetical protein
VATIFTRWSLSSWDSALVSTIHHNTFNSIETYTHSHSNSVTLSQLHGRSPTLTQWSRVQRDVPAVEARRRSMLQEAKQRDDTLVHAAMNAAPWKPDAEKRPRWYTHKVSHLGQQTGELPTSRRFRFQRWENSVTVHAARGWAHPLQTLQYPICFEPWVCFQGGGLPNPSSG